MRRDGFVASYKLIRYLVSYVFIVSGFMKLVSPDAAYTFLRLGLPYPYFLLNLVIFLEIVCGVLILIDKTVKNAVIPLIAIMIGALLLTKIPYIEHNLLQFAFTARLDIVMLVLLIILYRYPR
jgi:putative oxidoreductase